MDTVAKHAGIMAPALAAAVFSGAIYWITASFDAGFHDSAELALRAMQPGATHSPGAPLHTLLGHLLSRLLGDPAVATALLSVVPASLCAAALACIVASCVQGFWLPFTAAMTYALLFPVWGNAVEIELYSLSVFCIAMGIYAARCWLQAGSTGFPLAMTLACGFALAAHFASILLMPVFLWLMLQSCGWRDSRPWLFGFAIGAAVGVIAIANALLASNVPPFGEHVPLTIKGLLGYMSGAEHDPLSNRGLEHYVARMAEHARIFMRNFMFVGSVLVALGAWQFWRSDRRFGSFLGLLFVVYFGYFTIFGSGDYFLMVAPAYLIGCIWLAKGTVALGQWWPGQGRWQKLLPVLPAFLAAVLFLTQFDMRRQDARSTFAQDYVNEAFTILPQDSVVIARWNEFTLLRYHQYRWRLREDLHFILPARSMRHYHHGYVEDYLGFVAERVCSYPVVSNRITAELEALYRAEWLPDNDNWKVLTPRSENQCTETAAASDSAG